MSGQPTDKSVDAQRGRLADEFSRKELAALAREYLLAGQLIDRAGMPHVIAEFGRTTMAEIAIDEWMGASPIYTRRIQRLLGFDRGDVESIFKGMQFDIGAPPEFMDFRYRVGDSHHGEFWLSHCGALMDVEPMGPEYVQTMCHDIEDPTFDATASATNRYARMTPIHRPPRAPADRSPHCHWQVVIDETLDPLPDPPQMQPLLQTRLVALEIPELAGDQGEMRSVSGWRDYSTALDPDLRLEVFSKSTLSALIEEFALQSHLLVMSFANAIQRRSDAERAAEILSKQFIGSATLTAERLVRVLHTSPAARFIGLSRLERIALIIQLHPVFRPVAYVDLRLDLDGEAGSDQAALIVSLAECPATSEKSTSWISILAAGNDLALRALVSAVDPNARCEEIEPRGDYLRSWEVTIDNPGRLDGTRVDPPEVAVIRYSSGADFRFSDAVPVSIAPRR